MPAYSFEAVDALGAQRKGVIDAETARAARSALRAQALVPLQVTQVGPAAHDDGQAGGGVSSWWSGRIFGAAALAVWTRQLAGLVSATDNLFTQLPGNFVADRCCGCHSKAFEVGALRIGAA